MRIKESSSWQWKLFLLVIALSMIACQAVMGPIDDEITEASPQESVPQVVPEEEVDVEEGDESCEGSESYHPENGLCYLDGGQAEAPFISLMEGVAEYDEDFAENLLDDEYRLVTYEIDGDEIEYPIYEDVDDDLLDEQEDIALQEDVWDFYAAMIPAANRDFVSHYIVVTDGEGGSLAAVEQNPENPREWMLNVDIKDTENLQDLTFTLIHEYGHLLTLNAEEVEVDEYVFENPDDDDAYYDAEESCSTYFTGEGCAYADSYFYLFFDAFWRDLYDEWSEIQYIEDDDEYYEALDSFYFDYEDYFVTNYAATNPGEDIAESWAFFVNQAKPDGDTIAEQKILFFYQFPELVTLREEIIARAYSRMIRMQ